MLIELTQHATRCSDSSGQAQEYLIARHAAVETETVLVQICLELGAPSVICSLKECFQITDADAITAAFQEFTAGKLHWKPSVRKTLSQAKAQAQKTEHRQRDREKEIMKERGVDL